MVPVVKLNILIEHSKFFLMQLNSYCDKDKLINGHETNLPCHGEKGKIISCFFSLKLSSANEQI